LSSSPNPPGEDRSTRALAGQPHLKDLVDRSVLGEAEAFGSLYDFFVEDIYRYFHSHVADPHDVEDLVSRTFLRAWRAIPRFKWRGRPFEAWLFTLARNQLMDFYREHRATTSPLDEATPDTRTGPEALAVASLEARMTREALAKLTPDQRDVLVLKFFLDRENSEIAAILGKKEGTVRAIQMRALQALRRHLRNG
jgi:RNA polymerase sigma factor (sigma-70 family)